MVYSGRQVEEKLYYTSSWYAILSLYNLSSDPCLEYKHSLYTLSYHVYPSQCSTMWAIINILRLFLSRCLLSHSIFSSPPSSALRPPGMRPTSSLSCPISKHLRTARSAAPTQPCVRASPGSPATLPSSPWGAFCSPWQSLRSPVRIMCQVLHSACVLCRGSARRKMEIL